MNEDEGEHLIESLCTDFNGETEVRATLPSHTAIHVTGYAEYVRRAAGPHLRSIRHDGNTIYADLSPSYRIARILQSHTGQKQTTVPPVDGMDKDDVFLVMWALYNYRLEVLGNADAYDEFIENYDEIAMACAREAQASWDEDEPFGAHAGMTLEEESEDVNFAGYEPADV